jgi:elongation factor 3
LTHCSVRAAASAAASALVASLPAPATRPLLAVLFDACGAKRKWQSREAALNLLAGLVSHGLNPPLLVITGDPALVQAKSVPVQTAAALPDIVPRVSECISDTRAEVSRAAQTALLAACSVIGNRDIEPFVPSLVQCIAKPEVRTPSCVLYRFCELNRLASR